MVFFFFVSFNIDVQISFFFPGDNEVCSLLSSKGRYYYSGVVFFSYDKERFLPPPLSAKFPKRSLCPTKVTLSLSPQKDPQHFSSSPPPPPSGIIGNLFRPICFFQLRRLRSSPFHGMLDFLHLTLLSGRFLALLERFTLLFIKEGGPQFRKKNVTYLPRMRVPSFFFSPPLFVNRVR